MTLQPLAELLPAVVAQLTAHHPRGAPVTTWLATPTTTVLCPAAHPISAAPCAGLAGHRGLHVPGDGDDWDDDDGIDRPSQAAAAREVLAALRQPTDTERTRG